MDGQNMASTGMHKHRKMAIIWAVLAVLAAAVYAATFSVVFDLRDAGQAGSFWEPFVWPAAGSAVVAFGISVVYLVRYERSDSS